MLVYLSEFKYTTYTINRAFPSMQLSTSNNFHNIDNLQTLDDMHTTNLSSGLPVLLLPLYIFMVNHILVMHF